MRLTGGQNEDKGVVELCVSGKWTHVGLNQWDDFDAGIVCQNLYPGKFCKMHSLYNYTYIAVYIYTSSDSYTLT